MRKIIEEIVSKHKRNEIKYNEMINQIDDAFIEKKIDREIHINNIDENIFMLSIIWKEKGQQLTYKNVFQ